VSNLALDLRPTSLDQIIGAESAKKAIKSFAEKNNWPNVFLFYGPPGTGKTTFAQIVAKLVAGEDGDIHEINGSVQNKVEDARELSEIAQSRPFNGRPRVFIVNEFHRWTLAAQDAVKDTMEKCPAVWLITTDEEDKISPAILSRAKPATFRLFPLNKAQIWDLVDRASSGKLKQHDATLITEFLLRNDITAPREILGVLDQYLAGVSLEDAVHGSEHEPLYRDICGAVLNGNWAKASGFLAQVKTADSRGMISVLSAFFRSELVKLPVGPRADAIAACLVGMDQTGFADGVAYGSCVGLLYKAVKAIASATLAEAARQVREG
jgi:energy-coupling factor transporter ATP-binding protein EcfA2